MATKRKNRAGLKKVFEVYYQGGYIGRVEAKTAGAALRKARFEWGSSGDIDTKKMKVKQLGQLYSNPRKVAGKSTTLKNMASVTVTKLPNGVVKITGRKMAGNPTKRRCRICGRKMSAIALARHSCSNRDIALYNRSKNRRKR